MPSPIIIHGSSRSFGETRLAIQNIIVDADIPLIDLKPLDISPYDYDHMNRHDDLIPVLETMVQHDLIVLATPVYWYTMSGHMKIFLDRWTDALTIRKDLGRALLGKELYVIASFGTSLPLGFEDAFSQMCDYMDMRYRGCSFIYSGSDEELLAQNDLQITQARSVLGIDHD